LRTAVRSGVQIEFRRAGDTREQKWFVPTLLRFGLAPDLELRVEGSALSRLTSSDPLQGTLKTTGLSPTSVGTKYHLIAAAGVSRPSVGVIARLFPLSGTSVFRTRHVTGDVRLAADWDFAPNWSLNPNIGIAAYEDDVGRAYAAGLFATTLNYNPTKAVTLFVDVSVQRRRENSAARRSFWMSAWPISSGAMCNLTSAPDMERQEKRHQGRLLRRG
jgi:hypothetical protein